MHVQVITEPGNDNCQVCGNLTDGVRIHIFSTDTGAAGPFYCYDCLGATDRKAEVELELPETEDEGRKKSLRAQKKRSREQELEIAEELGGQMQRASGALSGSKGDIRKKGVVRVEAKYTEAGSYSLRLEELHKISSECHGTEKPVFVVDFVEKLTKRLVDRYAVVHFDDLKEWMDAAHKDLKSTATRQ